MDWHAIFDWKWWDDAEKEQYSSLYFWRLIAWNERVISCRDLLNNGGVLIEHGQESFEEKRHLWRTLMEWEWAVKPLTFTGTLMATASNRSFEENRFQCWLSDPDRPSTLKPPGRGAPLSVLITHTLLKDRESHARARAKETPEQADLRRKKDRERHAARRAELRKDGIIYTKPKQPYLDPREVDRKRALNSEAQKRWRARCTPEKKQELRHIRQTRYYPAEIEHKASVRRKRSRLRV